MSNKAIVSEIPTHHIDEGPEQPQRPHQPGGHVGLSHDVGRHRTEVPGEAMEPTL